MIIKVLIACHNRRDLTLRCVKSAVRAAEHAGAAISFFVYDDGSSDGTAEALKSADIALDLQRGDGQAFWARSMAAAEQRALSSSTAGCEDEYLLWLNDDVVLDREAVERLCTGASNGPCVVVGATMDPESGELSYSGLIRRGLHPLSFEMVKPNPERYQAVDTFNGNVVLVPTSVAKKLGGIDGTFSHAFADIDYGLRCGRAGVPVLLVPEVVGHCHRDPRAAPSTMRARWRSFVGVKGGGNFGSLTRILRKSHRASWPGIVAVTYATWWLKQLRSVLTGGNV